MGCIRLTSVCSSIKFCGHLINDTKQSVFVDGMKSSFGVLLRLTVLVTQNIQDNANSLRLTLIDKRCRVPCEVEKIFRKTNNFIKVHLKSPKHNALISKGLHGKIVVVRRL